MELNRMIDHTLLKPTATRAQIEKLCDEALEYHFASVCVNTCWVPLAHEKLASGDVETCCVVGFPLGAMMPEAKAAETRLAVEAGADEVDMVINIGWLLGGENDAGATFVKTSTGFSTGGATVEDVALMRKTVGDRCKVKAAGGILSAAEAKAMVEAGADRIGASCGIAIVKGE